MLVSRLELLQKIRKYKKAIEEILENPLSIENLNHLATLLYIKIDLQKEIKILIA